MKKILKSVYFLISIIKNLYYKKEIDKLSNGDYFLKYNVPSFTQWESKEMIEDIIKEKIDCKKDPLWKKSGAKNLEEYEMYSWQCCGMACLKMILKSVYPKKNYSIINLAKDASNISVYTANNSKNIRENLDGLMHSPFLKFIKKFNLSGKRIISIRENYLAHLILKNYFPIASVHPIIRETFYKNNSRKGHLVLVIGFRLEKGNVSGFFINNPSGFLSNQSQKKCFVPLKKWKKCFSGDANILKNNKD